MILHFELEVTASRSFFENQGAPGLQHIPTAAVLLVTLNNFLFSSKNISNPPVLTSFFEIFPNLQNLEGSLSEGKAFSKKIPKHLFITIFFSKSFQILPKSFPNILFIRIVDKPYKQ